MPDDYDPLIEFVKALARRRARMDAEAGIFSTAISRHVAKPTDETRMTVADDMKHTLMAMMGGNKMSTKGKLIVLAAFVKNDDGELVPAFEPRQVDTEERAKREARLMADQYVGVVAWSREADPIIGEYGPPVMLFQHGEIPDLE
jgi:hypothetical protein